MESANNPQDEAIISTKSTPLADMVLVLVIIFAATVKLIASESVRAAELLRACRDPSSEARPRAEQSGFYFGGLRSVARHSCHGSWRLSELASAE
jgi:hypothetical protein